jgi:hypothetical protein
MAQAHFAAGEVCVCVWVGGCVAMGPCVWVWVRVGVCCCRSSA